MIWNRRKKERMEMLKMIRPTSKAALKQQCLLISRGDVKQAKELYDFYSEGLETLPDFDVVPPTWMDSTKDTVVNVFNWAKDNQDTLMQMTDFIRGIIKNEAPQAAKAVEALPEINQ